mgnify:FL=1
MTKQKESLELFIDPFMASDEEAKKRNDLLKNSKKIAELEKKVTFKINMIPFG